MADLCLVSHAAGTRVFKGTIDNHPTVKRIVERCLADERFASAQPLRQPGAPAAHQTTAGTRTGAGLPPRAPSGSWRRRVTSGTHARSVGRSCP